MSMSTSAPPFAGGGDPLHGTHLVEITTSSACQCQCLHLPPLLQVEVIHFAAHISWKLSSIVLAPCDFTSPSSTSSSAPGHNHHDPLHHHHHNPFNLGLLGGGDSDDSASDVSSSLGGSPALSEYLLTAADVLNLRLHAKLVVLNSGYTDERAGRVNTDGVVGLTRALLSAGAQCVLFSLWPVPDSASKLLMRTLYGALQDGRPITQVRGCWGWGGGELGVS